MSIAGTIDIGAAAAGMVLSHHVLDSFGTVLLPAGVTLSEAVLASLHRRGIRQLQVQVPPAAPSGAPDTSALEAERERQCRRIAHLFRGMLRHGPAMSANTELLAQLLRYRKGN